MKRALKYSVIIIISMTGLIRGNTSLYAQELINLTLEKAVDIAMANSYRIKQLEMGIERTRLRLQARQASLRSRGYINLKAPQIESVSDYKWNSTLQKDQIVHENTRLWQMDIAIRQPVILFGYPTNGYLSLNNKINRYLQQDGYRDISYYNRYYVKFEQPLFLPNELKNDIEDAELDLEREELEYIRDRVRLIDNVSDDYYDLFEYTYKQKINEQQIENLLIIAEAAYEAAQSDSTRTMDAIQVQIELANTRENSLKNENWMRRQEMDSKQRLRLNIEDSVYVVPEFRFKPIKVDMEQAIQYGFSLSPTLRMLSINKRKDEIDVSNSKGRDAPHVNLEMTYGLEKQDDRHQAIWEEYDNSYSASLNAYVPIWDWGRRKARIEAEKISLKQTELRIEEEQNEIQSDIIIAVENLNEYQQRTQNMMESMKMVQEITDVSIGQYRNGNISIQDILQIVNRQRETEFNFLEVYLGYRRSLLSLMIQTYYDYENNVSLIDKYRTKS